MTGIDMDWPVISVEHRPTRTYELLQKYQLCLASGLLNWLECLLADLNSCIIFLSLSIIPRLSTRKGSGGITRKTETWIELAVSWTN